MRPLERESRELMRKFWAGELKTIKPACSPAQSRTVKKRKGPTKEEIKESYNPAATLSERIEIAAKLGVSLAELRRLWTTLNIDSEE